jgi:DNA-damage-inducible protein J
MATDSTINVRIDEQTKTLASDIFAACGLTTSAAIRMFLLRTVEEKEIPFNIHRPNSETIKALREDIASAKSYKSIEALLVEIKSEIKSEELAAKKSKRSARR